MLTAPGPIRSPAGRFLQIRARLDARGAFAGLSVALVPFLVGLAEAYGAALGALVIVASWILTWIYVRWANVHYDAELRRLKQEVSR